MGDSKLDNQVSTFHHKLGYQNTSKEIGHKLMTLSIELHKSHKEKMRNKREQQQKARIEFYQSKIYN